MTSGETADSMTNAKYQPARMFNWKSGDNVNNGRQ